MEEHGKFFPKKNKERIDAEVFATGMLNFSFLKNIQIETDIRGGWLSFEIKRKICFGETDLKSSVYR